MRTGYSLEETRRFWRLHSAQWRDLDRSADPEGLTNVCFEGAPLWLNKFAARLQVRTFHRLLEHVDLGRTTRIIDVGCGTGRWSRLLSERGARVTGIDLQPETLRANRTRLPGCRFIEMAADSMGFAPSSFDLAVSVTVIQHIPDAGQDLALKEIRRVLVQGGTYLMMEGTRDRGPHMFGNSIAEWRRKAVENGFRVERVIPYDFAPVVYFLKELAARHSSFHRTGDPPPEVEELVARSKPETQRKAMSKRLYYLALHGATLASYPLEPAVMMAAPARLAYHAGFLLRAV
ncbi:MAG TPA: class I SAM-dependent methyltransferase [Nitrospirales bacterium]|nr:class I SAM-dependent methyltransferase [Nitrospirales bacterium]